MRSSAAATAMIAFLWPRRGLRLRYRARRLEFFTLIAARAAWTSTGFSQGAPLRRRFERLRPALSSSRGHMPAQETRWSAVGKSVMSAPASASTVWATLPPKPGMSFSRSAAFQKGGEGGLEPCVEFRDGPLELLDRLQVLADQEPMMIARTSVQRGGEFLARASKPRMAVFGQPSRIALSRNKRLHDAPAADAQDVGNDR